MKTDPQEPPLSASSQEQAFDPYLELSPDAEGRLYAHLKADLYAGRKRKPGANRAASISRHLGSIVANLIVASRGGRSVHYGRGKRTDHKHSIYSPGWFNNRDNAALIDRLAELGLVDSVVAPPSMPGSFGKAGRKRSSYRATRKLLQSLQCFEITHHSVLYDGLQAPLLLMRASSHGPVLEYDPASPEFAERISLLERYNAYLAKQSVTLPGSTLPTSIKGNRLIRWFGASLQEHGRFYGGWWQSVPKAQRPNILINGNRTVELDFQGLAPRMLYHLEGLEYDLDPYDIPSLRSKAGENGIPWQDLRPVVKRAFGFVLNAKKRGGFDHSEAFKDLPAPFTPLEIVEAIEAHHHPIAHHFYGQKGVTLMNVESRVCERIIQNALELNILTLPIHDSFLIEESHVEQFRDIMGASYRSELNMNPIIR